MLEFFRIIIIIKPWPYEQKKVECAFCWISNAKFDFALLVWSPYIRYSTFNKFIVTSEWTSCRMLQKWVGKRTRFCPMSNLNVLCMHNTFESRLSAKVACYLSKMKVAKQTRFCQKSNVECDFVLIVWPGLKWHMIMWIRKHRL